MTKRQRAVLGWQTKLHRWAGQDEQQRFGDLFNLVCDPATLCRVGAGETQPGVTHRRCRWPDPQQVEQLGVDGVLPSSARS